MSDEVTKEVSTQKRTRKIVPYDVFQFSAPVLVPECVFSNTRLDKCVAWIKKNAVDGSSYEIRRSFGIYSAQASNKIVVKKV